MAGVSLVFWLVLAGLLLLGVLVEWETGGSPADREPLFSARRCSPTAR